MGPPLLFSSGWMHAFISSAQCWNLPGWIFYEVKLFGHGEGVAFIK